ncbi:RidA family protein [Deinococcus sp. KNUC1210]|uniref:RidA family protein n=1 Tax=Deinococcus sp. KNUC1210 TaxID=2917691 RepID=UPI001EF0186B|nr:RidA family protein [Deinococcus sp. KNUC1210]ULH16788.1 RidA family protein [Deinococcus sp. KNUC1210]
MRRNIAGTSPWESVVGYSRAVRVGPVVQVAGTTATSAGVVLHPGDAAGQTRAALAIIEEALREAGAELRHVIRTRLYVTDISQWEAIGRVHGEVFGALRPACSMVQVSALIDAAHLVEIEAEAYVWDDAGEAGSGE